jgi:hypothetical protein
VVCPRERSHPDQHVDVREVLEVVVGEDEALQVHEAFHHTSVDAGDAVVAAGHTEGWAHGAANEGDDLWNRPGRARAGGGV